MILNTGGAFGASSGTARKPVTSCVASRKTVKASSVSSGSWLANITAWRRCQFSCFMPSPRAASPACQPAHAACHGRQCRTLRGLTQGRGGRRLPIALECGYDQGFPRRARYRSHPARRRLYSRRSSGFDRFCDRASLTTAQAPPAPARRHPQVQSRRTDLSDQGIGLAGRFRPEPRAEAFEECYRFMAASLLGDQVWVQHGRAPDRVTTTPTATARRGFALVEQPALCALSGAR